MPKLTHTHVRDALLRKGFTRLGKGKHFKLVFVHSGKTTGIITNLRNSRDELTDGWIAGITKRLCMPNKEFFLGYISCERKAEEFAEHLRRSNKL